MWSIPPQPCGGQCHPDARLPLTTSLPSRRTYTAFHLHVCTPPRYLSLPLALPHQPDPAHPYLSVVPLPSPRTIQIQHTTAVRRGASWTAAYHLQPTVAAVARPVRSSVVPSESLLLSCPGLLLARRRLPGGASSRHPTVGRRRRGRHCQAPAMASVAGPRPACGVHPSGSSSGVRGPAVQPSGVQPVRCPVTWGRRPGSSGPAVRRPAVRCPTVWCPAVWRPPVQRPAGCCPPRRSGRVRLVHIRRWRWDQVAAASNLHHRNGSSPGGLPRPRAARSTAEEAWTRATLPRSRVGQWGVGGGSGPGRVVGGGGRA
jgi:hypothetical protein